MIALRSAVYGDPASIVTDRGHDFPGASAKHGETKDPVAFGVDKRFHESASFGNRYRAKDGGHGQLGKTVGTPRRSDSDRLVRCGRAQGL